MNQAQLQKVDLHLNHFSDKAIFILQALTTCPKIEDVNLSEINFS